MSTAEELQKAIAEAGRKLHILKRAADVLGCKLADLTLHDENIFGLMIVENKAMAGDGWYLVDGIARPTDEWPTHDTAGRPWLSLCANYPYPPEPPKTWKVTHEVVYATDMAAFERWKEQNRIEVTPCPTKPNRSPK